MLICVYLHERADRGLAALHINRAARKTMGGRLTMICNVVHTTISKALLNDG